jgi:hypothetical protein
MRALIRNIEFHKPIRFLETYSVYLTQCTREPRAFVLASLAQRGEGGSFFRASCCPKKRTTSTPFALVSLVQKNQLCKCRVKYTP